MTCLDLLIVSVTCYSIFMACKWYGNGDLMICMSLCLLQFHGG